ncbi:MAG: TetR/AcrR family transcriptional regulator [Myxococcota bacterium]
MVSRRKATSAEVAADRRKQILKAAVEVFADRGFHRTRVSDIAKQAGVAYGLIYHYFDSKDHVLNCVFDENWAVFLKVIEGFRDDPDRSAPDKLKGISALLIDALEVAPSTIQVLIQEVARSDRFVQTEKIRAFNAAFSVVRSIIESGQTAGDIKAEIDPEVAAYAFFGALETICTGFMLKTEPFSDQRHMERVKATVNQMMLTGLCRTVESP